MQVSEVLEALATTSDARLGDTMCRWQRRWVGGTCGRSIINDTWNRNTSTQRLTAMPHRRQIAGQRQRFDRLDASAPLVTKAPCILHASGGMWWELSDALPRWSMPHVKSRSIFVSPVSPLPSACQLATALGLCPNPIFLVLAFVQPSMRKRF